MASKDVLKTEAIQLGTKCQQNYYELLPDWFEYDSTNYNYIRHQVGYALFGHPQINQNKKDPTACTVPNTEYDIFDSIIYDKNSCRIIDKIYQQIIKYGRKHNDCTIYLGIIYNMIVFHQKSQKTSKEADSKPNEQISEINATPVFKIKKDINTVWYIDKEGRIYKNWKDYLTNNRLPKCTMILPKDGIYQCDPHHEVSKYTSMVWIETLDSPACAISNSIISALDIAANTVAVSAGIGLGVATLVTPVGPALLTAGLIANGVSSTWSIVRNSQKLVDFSKHKQSINPINKNAFPAWFGMGSSVLTIGASGGTMLLSRATRAAVQSKNIGTAVKIAHNSMVTIRGIGVVYDGFCLIDKYQADKKIDIADVTFLISHVLFFGNILINTNLAIELIESWRGTIFEKFRTILRFNRLTKEFKKFGKSKDLTAQNNSEGIIYRLKKAINTEDFFGDLKRTNWNKKFHIKYEGGKVIVNNVALIDPMVFMWHMLTIGTTGFNLMKSFVRKDHQTTDDIHIKLKQVLIRLLQTYYSDQAISEQYFDIDRFEELIGEIKYMTNPKDILIKIFKISTIVISRCNSPEQFLNEIIYFLWTYCKVTLKEHVANINSKINENTGRCISDLITTIVTCIYDYIDSIGDDLFAAFYTYISNHNRAETVASKY